MRKLNQSGISFSAVLLLLLFVGVVIFAGFKVYELNYNEVDDEESIVRVEKKTDNKLPATIESSEDLNKAEKTLNATDVDAGSSELDSGVADL